MNQYLKGKVAKIAGVALGIAMLASVATPALAQVSTSDLLAQIAALQAQLLAMQGSSSMSCNFTMNLSMGMTASEVRMLQQFLNTHGAQIAASGAGSPGNETMYFGALTKAAVVRWQNMNAASVLIPAGLTSGTGYWGMYSRNYANTQCGGVVVVPPVTTGGSAMVTGATQPASSLAVESAARLPFTKFTVTAGATAVTMNSVEVERTGLANDAVFSGVVLLGPDGQQIGIAKTLNSNHRTTVGDPVIIPAGTSMTFTLAGNMASNMDIYAGQVASLSLVGVNTNGTISGSFPITGASHTINASLAIGSVSVNTSGLVNTSSTIDIGEANTVQAGIRVTAGSEEDVRIWSIRWNQSGSAAPSDLANVTVKVNGTAYPTTVSADGKYYVASFGSGIVVSKGNTAEITVEASPVGGPNRTVKFDIYKTTDLSVTGELFGYGITPPAGSGTAAATTQEFTAGTPWYDGITKTINAGNVTTVSKSNSVPSQNIAVNLAEQPLGGFELDVKGEPISVQSLTFHLSGGSTTGGMIDDIDNITLTNLSTGQVVAGPKDATGGSTNAVTFTDTVTFPTGKSTFVLKGKLGTDFRQDQTIIASTTPSSTSDWNTITGQITGNTITLTNGIVTMNTMTVKVATGTLSVASTPSAQNVVVGQTGFTIAKLNFDATASGEDLRVNSFALTALTTTGASYPTNCFAYTSGGTRINSTAINPTADSAYTFNASTAFVVKKGTIETVDIKCDIPSNLTTNDTFAWTLNAVPSATGSVSGQSVTMGIAGATSNAMTFKSTGTFTVVKDSSSPSYTIVSAGQNNVTAGVLKFSGTNEDITLKKIALQLTNTASSSNATVTGVSLWNGATKVGSGLFTGTATTTQITLDQSFIIPKDGDAKLTVKVDLAAIGSSQSGVEGSLVAVDYDGSASTNTTEGTGNSSGTTIQSSSTSDTASDGLRVFRGYPTFAKVSLSSNTLSNGTDKDLLRFRVTANGNDVGIFKYTVSISTTTVTVTNVNINCYTDPGFSQACSGMNADGQMDASDVANMGTNDVEIYAENTGSVRTPYQISKDATAYFVVRGDIANSNGQDSVSTTLLGDAAYPILSTLMGTSTGVDNDNGGNDDFIWSPNATTSSTINHEDWTNGYQVAGLPSGGISDILSN